MKHKILMLISLILLLDIRESNAAAFNLGTGEIVLIVLGALFFMASIAGILLVCLYLIKKARAIKNES